MTTIGTVLLWTFAAIGFLCVAASLIFGLGGYYATKPKPPAKPRQLPASEVVARHTGNVRVIREADLSRGSVSLDAVAPEHRLPDQLRLVDHDITSPCFCGRDHRPASDAS